MTISLLHGFQSAVADNHTNGFIKPSHWNAGHTITLDTGRLIGRGSAMSGAAEEISPEDGIELVNTVLRLSNSGVLAGTYTNPNVTVDAKGRITLIENGQSPSAAAALAQAAAAAAQTAQAHAETAETNAETAETNAEAAETNAESAQAAAEAARDAAIAASENPGFTFTFDSSTTDADPGSGDFRLNNATVGSATVAYFDNQDFSGNNVTGWLDSFDNSGNTSSRGIFYLKGITTPTAFLIGLVTGSVVDGTGYRKVTFIVLSSGGTFTAAHRFSLIFSPTGASVGLNYLDPADYGTPQLASEDAYGKHIFFEPGQSIIVPVSSGGTLTTPGAALEAIANWRIPGSMVRIQSAAGKYLDEGMAFTLSASTSQIRGIRVDHPYGANIGIEGPQISDAQITAAGSPSAVTDTFTGVGVDGTPGPSIFAFVVATGTGANAWRLPQMPSDITVWVDDTQWLEEGDSLGTAPTPGAETSTGSATWSLSNDHTHLIFRNRQPSTSQTIRVFRGYVVTLTIGTSAASNYVAPTSGVHGFNSYAHIEGFYTDSTTSADAYILNGCWPVTAVNTGAGTISVLALPRHTRNLTWGTYADVDNARARPVTFIWEVGNPPDTWSGSHRRVTGVANNGSGLARVALTSTTGLTTGDTRAIEGVGGATGVNGTHTITVVDGTHIDLQGSTFGGSYTSGGICVEPRPTGNSAGLWILTGLEFNRGVIKANSDYYDQNAIACLGGTYRQGAIGGINSFPKHGWWAFFGGQLRVDACSATSIVQNALYTSGGGLISAIDTILSCCGTNLRIDHGRFFATTLKTYGAANYGIAEGTGAVGIAGTVECFANRLGIRLENGAYGEFPNASFVGNFTYGAEVEGTETKLLAEGADFRQNRRDGSTASDYRLIRGGVIENQNDRFTSGDAAVETHYVSTGKNIAHPSGVTADVRQSHGGYIQTASNPPVQSVLSGGTGLSAFAQGDLLYGSATNTLSALAKNTSATRYLANTGTSNNPAWAQIDLTNGVTGDLPFANIAQLAQNRIAGRISSGTGDIESLTAANVVSIIDGSIAETGTWTPVFSYATNGDNSVVYTTQEGSYCRVGKLVFVRLRIDFTPTFTTASGNAQLTGFPFATADTLIGGPLQGHTGALDYPASRTFPVGRFSTSTVMIFVAFGSGGGSSAFTTSHFASAEAHQLILSFCYRTS